MRKYFKIVNGEIIYSDGRLLKTENNTIINPTEELMLDNGWLIYIEPEPSLEELLLECKLRKIIEIELYDLSNSVNIFYLGSLPLWLDAQTRLLLRTSIIAYLSQGIENVTKWFNGELYTFSVEMWLYMLNALEIYAAEALNVTEMHKAQVLNLQTIEEIENYDITSDYPEILNLMPRK